MAGDGGQATRAARVTGRAHELPALQLCGVAGGDGREARRTLQLQDRGVTRDAVADYLGGVAPPRRRHDHLDRRRTCDHVVVRQHLAARRQHHSGAGGLSALVAERRLDHDDAGARRLRRRRVS